MKQNLSTRKRISVLWKSCLVAAAIATPFAYSPSSNASTELPMEISQAEEMMFLTVPDTDTTQSAYGGRLRLYDVHVSKMFEVTHHQCQRTSSLGSVFWSYSAGGGSIRMGRFKIECDLAKDLAIAYGLGKPERTVVQQSGEEGYRNTVVFSVPIFSITGGKIDRWMRFTSNFNPMR